MKHQVLAAATVVAISCKDAGTFFFFFHGEGQLSWFYGPPSLLSIYIVEIGALSMHGAGTTKDISAENFPPAMLL